MSHSVAFVVVMQGWGVGVAGIYVLMCLMVDVIVKT